MAGAFRTLGFFAFLADQSKRFLAQLLIIVDRDKKPIVRLWRQPLFLQHLLYFVVAFALELFFFLFIFRAVEPGLIVLPYIVVLHVSLGESSEIFVGSHWLAPH